MAVYLYVHGKGVAREAELIWDKTGIEITEIHEEVDKQFRPKLKKILERIQPGDWFVSDLQYFELDFDTARAIYEKAVRTANVGNLYGLLKGQRLTPIEAITRNDRHNAQHMKRRLVGAEHQTNKERKERAQVEGQKLVLEAIRLAEEYGFKTQTAVAGWLVDHDPEFKGKKPAAVQRNLSNALQRAPVELRRTWKGVTG